MTPSIDQFQLTESDESADIVCTCLHTSAHKHKHAACRIFLCTHAFVLCASLSHFLAVRKRVCMCVDNDSSNACARYISMWFWSESCCLFPLRGIRRFAMSAAAPSAVNTTIQQQKMETANKPMPYVSRWQFRIACQCCVCEGP